MGTRTQAAGGFARDGLDFALNTRVEACSLDAAYTLPPRPTQEEEEDYRRQFPDQQAAFADLGDAQGEPADFSADPPLPQQPGPGGEDQPAAATAAYLARDLMLGEVLQDIVAVHGAAFGRLQGGAAGVAVQPAVFLKAYELGVDILRAGNLLLPASLDEQAATGHLYAACCRLQELTLAPGAEASSSGGQGSIDMQGPCVAEAVLVQQPVLALRRRLLELLEQWPEHPILLQLAAIVDRLLSLPVTSPLKAVLTGLELLLTRAQVRWGCCLVCLACEGLVLQQLRGG